jgi:hypothetical protein
VTGFTIRPRLSRVRAPSSGVTLDGPKTTFEVPRAVVEFEERLADVIGAASSVGQCDFLASEFREREFSRYRASDDAVNCAGIDQEIELDCAATWLSRVGDPHFCKCDSHPCLGRLVGRSGLEPETR